jgi:hypothetical protein
VAITRGGRLTPEAREGLVKRVALWLVPHEVTELSGVLDQEILRLGREQLEESSWRMGLENGEAVLVVTGPSVAGKRADTVADALFGSFEALKGYKDKILGYVRPSSG